MHKIFVVHVSKRIMPGINQKITVRAIYNIKLDIAVKGSYGNVFSEISQINKSIKNTNRLSVFLHGNSLIQKFDFTVFWGIGDTG